MDLMDVLFKINEDNDVKIVIEGNNLSDYETRGTPRGVIDRTEGYHDCEVVEILTDKYDFDILTLIIKD